MGSILKTSLFAHPGTWCSKITFRGDGSDWAGVSCAHPLARAPSMTVLLRLHCMDRVAPQRKIGMYYQRKENQYWALKKSAALCGI